MIYLNQHFGILDATASHLNILLDRDIEVFIDPSLIKSEGYLNSKIQNRCVSFLTKLNEEFVKKKNEIGALHFLSKLHEPKEFHIGYCSNSISGKAIGIDKSKLIYNSLVANPLNQIGLSILNDPFNVLLLVEGIGQDNMSDLIANICRDLFSEFTQQQCLKYNIPVFATEIQYFDEKSLNWVSKNVHLPAYLGEEVIFIPDWMVNKQRAFTTNFNRHVCSKYIWEEYIKDGNLSKSPYFLDCIFKKKDGSIKPIIKVIYNKYKKDKKDFYKFVISYNDSIDTFLEKSKLNYPKLTFEDLVALYKKAS